MQDYRGRPLTRHEIQVRLLFQHADEIIKKLEFLNYSADKLERLEVMINGFDGAPGLIELVEGMSFEINKLERWGGRTSNVDFSEVSLRLSKVEALLDRNTSAVEVKQKDQNTFQEGWRVTACMWGIFVLVLLNLLLFASSVIV